MTRKGNNLTFDGASASVNGVANFITALKRSGYFQKVEIKESKQDEKNTAVQTFVFQIYAEITPPAAGVAATRPQAKPASARRSQPPRAGPGEDRVGDMANPFRDMSVIMQGLLAVAITVVLVVVGVYLPFSPVAQERDEVDKAVRQRSQLNQEVTQLQVYKQRYGELKQQMDALSKQLETLKAIVPEEKEVDEFHPPGAGRSERFERCKFAA